VTRISLPRNRLPRTSRPTRTRQSRGGQRPGSGTGSGRGTDLPSPAQPGRHDEPLAARHADRAGGDRGHHRLAPGASANNVIRLLPGVKRFAERVVNVIELQPNPEYPRTTPEGGTGKGRWVRE